MTSTLQPRRFANDALVQLKHAHVVLQFQNIEFVDDDCNAEEGNANAEKINNDDENDNGNHDNYDNNADGDNDNNGNDNQARDAAAGAAPSAGKIASSSIVVDGSSS